jgi:hypothetical protein
MSHILMSFGEQLTSGLRRKAVTTASRWAETYRRTKDGAPWSFRRYPWSRGMHDSTSEYNVAQKGAQLAVTETVLDIGFFANDVRKADVLYVLPKATPEASDFSKARFDAAVEVSPRLKQLYSDVSNIGHKRAGAANFYIRGGQSESGLKSVPVSVLIMDEIEHMPEANITLAEARVSGQIWKLIWALSTPTIHHHGINRLFLQSSQDKFFFKCPNCDQYITLEFPDCLAFDPDGDPDSMKVINESYLKCPRAECSKILPHEGKVDYLKDGIWVPTFKDKQKRGFYINQLFSTTVTPGAIAAAYLRSRIDASAEQEFWNSMMGLPFEPAGSKVSLAQVEACIAGHGNGTIRPHGKVLTMGVDVGFPFCHYEIDEWNLGDWQGNDINASSKPRVIKTGKVRSFDELDGLMYEYEPFCVIDSQPERRKAFEFANRHFGRVKMCIYGNGVSGKHINEHKSDEGEPLITVDRSSWLEQSQSRFQKGNIELPRDIPFEYRAHVTTPARIWKPDQYGNPVAVFITPTGQADHHAHARNYAEIALPLALAMGQNSDVESPL